jgi:microcystin-dependent protein
MSDPFVGQIDLFPYDFAPQGYLPCDGIIYPIRQYEALFSLIQYTYGGVVNQTFAVPKLCGLAAVGLGTIAGGIIPWTPGSVHGEEAVTLTISNLPNHTHSLNILGALGADTAPTTGGTLAGTKNNDFYCTPVGTQNTQLASVALSVSYTGPGAHTNRQPYVILRPCIAWDGVFPDFS